MAATSSSTRLNWPSTPWPGWVMASGRLGTTRKAVAPHYREKERFVEQLLSELMPSDVDWRMHSGDGGMLCLLRVDRPWFDDAMLYSQLKRKHVFAVLSQHFFVEPQPPGLAEHAT
ncbi:hypothetical protein [Streptomyces caniscabiei]|uniref:hypothetical protein n=1 Tax=Streptomyces caniscabiei TaxID=2746961 RepID=UPI001180A918|nr:hypothetical protein [Streptomyces caniscabiei]